MDEGDFDHYRGVVEARYIYHDILLGRLLAQTTEILKALTACHFPIVNRSGAHAWTHLEGAEEAFLKTLWDLNVLVKEPTENTPDETVPPGADPPGVISSRRIQVAAGSRPLGDFGEYGQPIFDEQGNFDAYGRHRLDDQYGQPLFRDPMDENFK